MGHARVEGRQVSEVVSILREWWHGRTNDVEGIHKLIGEPGSPWRAHVVHPIALAVIAVAVAYLLGDEKR